MLGMNLLTDKSDVAHLTEFAESYRAGKEFMIPDAILRRELKGESVVKLWREERKLTQQELAEKAGISKPYLSQIETGKRQGTLETMAAIAKVLEVPLDVLVE